MFFLHDVKYALRTIQKNLTTSGVVIASIGLGIGLNITVFSILNAVLLRPVPGLQNPRELTQIYTSYSGGMKFGAVSYPDYADWNDRNAGFSGMLAQRMVLVSLDQDGANNVVPGALVSGNYFDVLGVRAAYGRTFSSAETPVPGSSPIVVISDGLWKRYFGADPNIVGRKIRLNAHSFTVAGVAPRSFAGANVGIPLDLWVPLNTQAIFIPRNEVPGDLLQARGERWLQVIGRIRSGITVTQSQSRMSILADELGKLFPATNAKQSITVVHLGDGPDSLESNLAPVIKMLMCIVVLVLLIACFNVANLLLAKAAERRGEMALRLALGASSTQLGRLFVLEAMLLCVTGGILALGLAYAATSFIASLDLPTPVPIRLDLTLDGPVLLFAWLLSLISGAAVGLAPALRVARSSPADALQESGSSRATGRSWVRNALVVAQVSASILLLITAGLMIRSVGQAQKADMGFRSNGLVNAAMDLGFAGYDKAQGKQFYVELLRRVSSLPGVLCAGLAESVPLEIGSTQQIGVLADPKQERGVAIDYNVISPGYFRIMGISVTQGREFSEEDRENGPGVAIVNEAFAQRYWPGQDPIGKQIKIEGNLPQTLQIVGVAKNSKYYDVKETVFPFLYLSLWQNYQRAFVLQARTAGNPVALLNAIRREVALVNPAIPVFRLRTMDDQIGASLISLRLGSILLGVFGSLGLVLATVGIYAIVAHSVDKRIREIGVYIALGASREHVFTLILKQGMKLAFLGIALGVALALPSMSLLSSLLYGVRPADPATLIAVSLTMSMTALIASLIPARKAMRLDPIAALRHE